ncbi:MAG: hypothetical protein WCR97_03785 [Bacilli bacterium]
MEKEKNKEEKKKSNYTYKNHYKTGEDIDMLHEKNKRSSDFDCSICDIHEDGA